MFYSFNMSKFPVIHHSYTVSRSTSWQIVDDNNIIFFISDGCCEVSCNNENYTLEKGDVFFVPALQPYTRRPLGDTVCTMHYVHFSIEQDPVPSDLVSLYNSVSKIQQKLNMEALSDETVQYPNTIYLENKIQNTNYDELKELFASIDIFSTDRQIMCGMQSLVSLCNILVYLSKKTISAVLSDQNIKNSVSFPVKLKKALTYIVKHSNKQITLDELAEHCHISKHQLIRYFKNSLGTTPINYINDYKLARAKEMLFHQSPLSIKEISEELGFSSQYYFTKLFTKTTGETPSAYRYRTTNYNKIHNLPATNEEE